VDLAGDGLINFQIGQPVTRQPTDAKGNKLPLASNTGTINADGGVVTMTARAAGSVVDSVVNVGGAIRAQAVTQENGVLVLGAVNADAGDGGTVNVTGKVDVSGKGMGQRGGQVVATTRGGRVNVASTAAIDASGFSGGGQVNIGGSYQGKGPVANARNTTVETGARINADATALGNGGSVIVWADNATVFGGTITAKGGLKGGDGGFIETSGKINLSVSPGAAVNASAVAGRAGTWLLDPRDVIIQAGGDPVVGGVNNPPDEPGPYTIDAASIAAALNGGSNVTITTNAIGVAPNNAGDITVQSGTIISWSTNNSLTLNADRHILVNGTIDSTSATFAFDRISLRAGLTNTSGAITVAGTISAGGGVLDMSAAGGVTLSGSLSSTGRISIRTSGANASITQTASSAISTDLLMADATGSVQLVSANNQVTQLTGSAGGDFRYVGTKAVALGFTTDGPIEGVTVGEGRYVDIAAPAISIVQDIDGPWAPIGAVTGTGANNVTGVVVFRPSTLGTSMIIGGTIDTGLTEEALVGGIRAGTLRIGSTGRAEGTVLGNATTAAESAAGSITVQGLNLDVSGSAITTLVLESGTGSITQTESGSLSVSALATSVVGGGSVVLDNEFNDVGTIAHIARVSDTTLGTQTGSYQFVGNFTVTVGSVGKASSALVGQRDSGETAGLPAGAAIVTSGGNVSLTSAFSSATININAPLVAIGAVVTLNEVIGSINNNASGTIDVGSTGTLNLNAAGSINLFAAPVIAGVVNFIAGGTVFLDNANNIIGTIANTPSKAGTSISINNKSALTIGPGGMTAGGTITIQSSEQVLVAGNITSTGTSGALSITSTGAIDGVGIQQTAGTMSAATVSLNATAGDIVQTGGNIVAPAGAGFDVSLRVDASGSVDLSSATNDVVDLVGSAGGDFRYVDATGFDIDAGTELVWGAGSMSLKANDGVISINGTIRSTAPSASTTLTIDATSDGNSTVIGGGGSSSAISLGNGTLNLIGGGDSPAGGINLDARITAGVVNFKATIGVNLNNADNVIGTVAQIASSAGDQISIRSASSLVIGPGGITAGPGGERSGVISIISAGQVRVDGDIIAPASTSGGLFIQSTGAIGGVGILQTTGKIFSGQETKLSATAGDIVQTGGTISGPSINLSASGNITQTGGNIIETVISGGPSATLVVNAGGSVDLSSPTNDVITLVGSAGGDFRFVDVNTLNIGEAFTVPIGITIGAGRYLDIAADTINILAGARIGGIATGSPGSSFPADNPTGVTVLRPTSANAPMVVGGSSGTTGTLLTEANLLASVQTGTLRLGSIGRAAGLQLGGAITALENPTGTITIQGLNFSGAGQLLQRLVLESGAAGLAIQQTGAIRLTRDAPFEGALATAVRGGGSVELTNPNNSVTGLAHVARESDTTLATQSGTFRYVDESTIPVVSVAGPGTRLIGDRNSGDTPGAPANSAILTNGGDVTLVSRTGSIEFINGLAAIGATARLSAVDQISQSAIGGVVANGLLAVAGAVDLSAAAGLNNVRFLSGSAFGLSEGTGNFRLINAASVTVPDGGVAGDSLVATVNGVHAASGATLELAIGTGDIVVNNTTLTAAGGLVLLRRVAGATGSEIILNNVSFDSGSGSPNLVVLDLTGSPGVLSGSFDALKSSATPPSGTSAIPLGPNPDGGILLTNVNAGNTTVYLVGGTGSTIAGSGTYGLLGVYVAHSNPIALTGSVRQIDPTTSHSVTAPFSEPFDSTTFAGFYVRRRGAAVDVQTFNTCVIGTGICPTPPPPPPPEEEVRIPERLQRPPDDPGRLVGTPDLLIIDFATDRPTPTPLGLSTVILVNQGNEYFFNVDEERRKQRAARGGQ